MTLAPLREPGRFDTAESGGFPIIYEKKAHTESMSFFINSELKFK